MEIKKIYIHTIQPCATNHTTAGATCIIYKGQLDCTQRVDLVYTLVQLCVASQSYECTTCTADGMLQKLPIHSVFVCG